MNDHKNGGRKSAPVQTGHDHRAVGEAAGVDHAGQHAGHGVSALSLHGVTSPM